MGAEVEIRLAEAIHKNIKYHATEYDLTYTQVLGVLAFVRRDVEDQALGNYSGFENEDEDDN